MVAQGAQRITHAVPNAARVRTPTARIGRGAVGSRTIATIPIAAAVTAHRHATVVTDLVVSTPASAVGTLVQVNSHLGSVKGL